MKYRLDFAGFVYVEADSPEEALEKAMDGNTVYEEQGFDDPMEVEEFDVQI